jgi:hypothetical protein
MNAASALIQVERPREKSTVRAQDALCAYVRSLVRLELFRAAVGGDLDHPCMRQEVKILAEKVDEVVRLLPSPPAGMASVAAQGLRLYLTSLVEREIGGLTEDRDPEERESVLRAVVDGGFPGMPEGA